MVFQNGKRSEVMDSRQSPAYFCVPKIWWSHLYQLCIHLQKYLCNQRLAKVTSHCACKIRKITKFPVLLLVRSCLPPVDTLKQISNEQNVRYFSQHIWTCSKSTIGKLGKGVKQFKVNNEDTRSTSMTSFWYLYR